MLPDIEPMKRLSGDGGFYLVFVSEYGYSEMLESTNAQLFLYLQIELGSSGSTGTTFPVAHILHRSADE